MANRPKTGPREYKLRVHWMVWRKKDVLDLLWACADMHNTHGFWCNGRDWVFQDQKHMLRVRIMMMFLVRFLKRNHVRRKRRT